MQHCIVRSWEISLNWRGFFEEEKWCIGMILPLNKNKGDMNNTLTCIAKLFTAALNDRPVNFIEAFGTTRDE